MEEANIRRNGERSAAAASFALCFVIVVNWTSRQDLDTGRTTHQINISQVFLPCALSFRSRDDARFFFFIFPFFFLSFFFNFSSRLHAVIILVKGIYIYICVCISGWRVTLRIWLINVSVKFIYSYIKFLYSFSNLLEIFNIEGKKRGEF